MVNKIGLRDKKKGLLKLLILDTAIGLLENRHFDEIKVKDICNIVNISEVTFFKYFGKKEEILQFFLQVWNYKREIKLYKNCRLKGKPAIYQIFSDIAKTPQSKEIMLTLFNYISKLKEKPDSLELKPYEKFLLFENEEPIIPISLTDQISKHLKEYDEPNSENMLFLISTIYYGTPLISHVTGISLGELYIQNLNTIFNTKENNCD